MQTTPDGGIGHYSHCLANALVERGNDVGVLTRRQPDADLPALDGDYTFRPQLRSGTGRVGRVASALANVATVGRLSCRSDVFHAQWTITPRVDRASWSLLHRLRVPIVLTLHDVLPHERLDDDIVNNIWLARASDAVIVHGQRLREALVEMSGVDTDRITVLPHGNYNFIADEVSPWQRDEARRSLGVDDDFVVLFFGFIRPYKGLDILIDACRNLIDTQPTGSRIRLAIAGRTLFGRGLGSELTRRLDEAGLADRVLHHAEYIPMTQIGRYFAASDVVAMPYRSGSQSGVLQLAYAYGRPAIVTSVGSIAEAAIDGETALVVPPEDTGAFADALARLRDDPDLANRIGVAGRRYAEQTLGWGPIAAATEEIYRSVIDR